MAMNGIPEVQMSEGVQSVNPIIGIEKKRPRVNLKRKRNLIRKGDKEMKEDNQGTLFNKGEWWEEDWQGMPEFVQNDEAPVKTIYVHFKNKEDIKAFELLVKQRITSETKSIWYPKVTIERYIDKQYTDIAK